MVICQICNRKQRAIGGGDGEQRQSWKSLHPRSGRPRDRLRKARTSLRSPAPRGGQKHLRTLRHSAFPLRRSGKSPPLVDGQQARCVLSLAGFRGPGRARGRGRGAAVGSKVTARTTWAGDSVLPAAAAARRALGLVARRAARTAEPDACSRRHGHQNGRVAGDRPGRRRPGAQLAGRWQGAAGRGR